MSEQIITERQLRSLKRHAKQRAREDKNLTYMQHLDAVSVDLHGCRFEEAKALSETRAPQVHSPMSLYMQACQDAYFDL
jgi:hypothetical protein